MADARKMGKSELFSHFADHFDGKRAKAREFFEALAALAEAELKKSGEFSVPGMVKLVVQNRKARVGRRLLARAHRAALALRARRAARFCSPPASAPA